MFGLGFGEIILIAVVALVVVGPKRLPDIAKSLGKGYGEFRRSLNDIKQTINLNDTNINTGSKKSFEETKNDLIENYRTQWEQQLDTKPSPDNNADNEINTDNNGDKRA